MATAQLSATRRNDTGKGSARALRRDGQIPAVIYGHARQTQSLAIPQREFEKLLSHISADNTVIELGFEGSSSRALIREVQRHPFKRAILHIDFQEIVAGEMMTVRVPIRLVGTPVGVRLGGGIIDHTLRELTISVDPAKMPNHIDVDVTDLDLGQSIHVSQLAVPEGAVIQDELGAPVVVIATPRAAIEAVVAEVEPTGAEPEVIRAKKPEEGGEGDAKK